MTTEDRDWFNDWCATHYTDEVVCPYCHYEFSDSWEFSDNGDIVCDECNKEFFMYRHIEVSYVTEKNNEDTKDLQ